MICIYWLAGDSLVKVKSKFTKNIIIKILQLAICTFFVNDMETTIIWSDYEIVLNIFCIIFFIYIV
jgi:hypothetical protein